jgi:NitT/TauT family transport system substrate-binding protein
MALLAGTSFSTLAFKPGHGQPRQKVNIVMGASAFYFVVHHTAEAAGFFDQEGLVLDGTNVSSGPRQVAAIMGGSADVGPLGLQLVVQAAQRGGEMVAICAGYNILPMSVVLSNAAVQRAGITPDMPTDEKIRRLRGMRIGVTTPGSGTDDMIRALLRARGMDAARDLTIQPLVTSEAMVAALERGSSDGFVFSSPINEMVVSRNLGQIVIEPLRGDVPEAANVPYIILATTRGTARTKRPLLLAMVRAHTRAMGLIQEQPAEVSRLIRRYFPDMDQAVYDEAFAKYRAGAPTTPVISPEQVQNVAAFMRISKGQPIAIEHADVVDTSFAEEALATLRPR